MDRSKFLNLALAVGTVISTDISNRARVLVQLNRFNPLLKTYFSNKEAVETYNPDNHAKNGDIVLIGKMDEVRRKVETHQVQEVIYSAGFVIDPMTGIRVNRDKYIHDDVIDKETLQELVDSMKEREYAPKFSFEWAPEDVIYSEQ